MRKERQSIGKRKQRIKGRSKIRKEEKTRIEHRAGKMRN